MKLPYEIVKVSNHGTSNPIVARLVLQTKDLLQWLDATKLHKDAVLEKYFELNRRLLNCYEIQQRLITARETTLSSAQEDWDKGGNATPHVIGLQNEVEGFLYAAKVYLREVARLLNALFDARLDNEAAIFWDKNGGDSKVVKWAKENYGEGHGTTRMLASEAEWVSEIVRMRNAVEHPGGHSGTLILTNYERTAAGIVPPLWGRDGKNPQAPADLYKDIDTSMENLLTFAEDLLVNAIAAKPVIAGVRFGRIPEDERDANSPIRIRVMIDLPGH